MLLAGVAHADPVSLSPESTTTPLPVEVAAVAWAEGDGAVALLRGSATLLGSTSDGGQRWSQLPLERGAQRPLGALAAPPVFTGPKTGLLAAGEHTWLTTNGGKTWKDAFPAYSAAAASPELVWVGVPSAPSHWQSRISEDGGRSWLDCGPRVDASEGRPLAAELGAGGVGLLVTGGPGLTGAVWATADGGCNWRRLGAAPAGAWRSITAADAAHAWLVGARGELAVSADGGASWAPHPAPAASALRFTSASEGWLLGPDGRLHRSLDGGASWTALSRADALAALATPALAGWDAGRLLALLLAGGAPYPEG